MLTTSRGVTMDFCIADHLNQLQITEFLFYCKKLTKKNQSLSADPRLEENETKSRFLLDFLSRPEITS